MNVKEIVEKVIKEQLLFHWDVKPENRLIEDLLFDSLDCVEMLMGLEEAFEVDIPDEVAESWKTVEDVISYFEKLKGSLK